MNWKIKNQLKNVWRVYLKGSWFNQNLNLNIRFIHFSIEFNFVQNGGKRVKHFGCIVLYGLIVVRHSSLPIKIALIYVISIRSSRITYY